MMTRRWFSLLTLLAAATLVLPLLAGPAAAQSLDELRASGKVGERYDGFAEARDPAVAAQVKEINAKRTANYQQQADKEGVPLAEDRKSGVKGKSVSVRVALGGRRSIQKNNQKQYL